MLAALQGTAKELDTLLVSLDVATLHAPDAVKVLEAASAVETRAAAIKEAYAEGRRDSAGAYRMDALDNLLCGGGAKVESTVVIRVDARRLAGGEGVCETATGALPVEDAIGAILAGAAVTVLGRDGIDVTTVCSGTPTRWASPGAAPPPTGTWQASAITTTPSSPPATIGWREVRVGGAGSRRPEASQSAKAKALVPGRPRGRRRARGPRSSG